MTTSWKSLKNSLKSWTTMGVVDGEELCKYLDFGHEENEDEYCAISCSNFNSDDDDIVELAKWVSEVEFCDSTQELPYKGNPSTIFPCDTPRG